MQDKNFRATVLLMLYENGSTVKKELDALVRKHKVRKSDSDELHPALNEYLYSTNLDDGTLASLTVFLMPFSAIQKVMPLWDGEEYPFYIRSFADLAYLPNIQSFEWYEHQFETEVEPLLAHPALRHINISTRPNAAVIAQLEAAGWRIETQDPYGQTVLVRD